MRLRLSLRLYLNNQLRAHSLSLRFWLFRFIFDLVMFDFVAIFAACLFAGAFLCQSGVLY